MDSSKKVITRKKIIDLINQMNLAITGINQLRYNQCLDFLENILKINKSQSIKIASNYIENEYEGGDVEKIIEYLGRFLLESDKNSFVIKNIYYNKIIDKINRLNQGNLKIQ